VKLIPTLVKHFPGCSFKRDLMCFQYGASLYQIVGVSERSIKYTAPGDDGPTGSLTDMSSYQLMSVSIKNSLRGPRIVFRIDS
jgi:hypothetical protein